MNNKSLIVAAGMASLLLTSVMSAQTAEPGSPARANPPSSTSTTPSATYDSVPDSTFERRDGGFGASAGDLEFTLAGKGTTNKDFDNSAGGLSASLGYYVNDTLELALRQSANYVNPDGGDDGWAASSWFAIDQHLGSGRFRPFVGASVGALYGDETEDTFAAGLEAGLKFYVQPKTFVFFLAEYVWAFDDSDDADDTFEDGGLRWTAGIGFNF